MVDRSNSRQTDPMVKYEPLVDEDEKKSKGCCSCTNNVKFYLYGSHLLSTWGQRMWQFAVGMFMIALSPGSLRLTAIYGLTGGTSILLTGAIVGDWIDRFPRFKVGTTCLLVQNICIALSGIAVYFTISYEDEVKVMWGGWLQVLCHALIIIFANIADIATNGRTLAIERDWVVVICDDTKRLTEMSAFLRRIDLSCVLLAPVIAGQVITYGSLLIGALFLSGWNLVSLCFEYYMLHRVYHMVPGLASKNDIPKGEKSGGVWNLIVDSILILPKGWKIYATQMCSLAGLGLACLYMTVIGLDNVTTGFAKEQGLTESVISIFMGLAGITGIVGTFFFPTLREKIGLLRTGLVAFTVDTITLIPCLVSVFLPGSPFDPTFQFLNKEEDTAVNSTTMSSATTEQTVTDYTSIISILTLMIGIVISRIGLWSADLTVTQLLIETPSEEERGVVNGVQASLNRTMDMIKFILVIVVPWPEAFGYLIMVSFLSCFIGAICYYVFSYKQRGHVLPFHKYRTNIKSAENGLLSDQKKTYGTAEV